MRERALQVRGKKDLGGGGGGEGRETRDLGVPVPPLRLSDYEPHHAQPELERVRHAGGEGLEIVLEIEAGGVGGWRGEERHRGESTLYIWICRLGSVVFLGTQICATDFLTWQVEG